MKIKIYSFFMLIVILCAGVFASNNIIAVKAYSPVSSPAKAVSVVEGNTGTVLFGKNENVKLAMASTTKIVTAIVAIENLDDLDKTYKINNKAVGIEGTSIYLKNDEELTARELLYGVILASGNDASVAIAHVVCSTEEEFVAKMNKLAKDLGLENTQFKNSHGLDENGHYTTAKDLAILTAYAMKNETFKEIVSTQHKQITGHPQSGERYLRNKNRLVFTQNNNVGVKTGFTDDAGRCLVNAVEEDDMLIITVLLNCSPMFEEARRLTTLALKQYTMKEFIAPYNYVGSVDVVDGEKENINIINIKGYKVPIKIEDEDLYEVVYDLPEYVEAPITKDDVIGEVNIYYNDEVIFSEKLYCIESVKNVNIKYMLNNIIENWF